MSNIIPGSAKIFLGGGSPSVLPLVTGLGNALSVTIHDSLA